MATFHLSWKSFETSETSKDFLESYIKRLKSYIEMHDISQNYLDDITERLVEKLSQLEKNETTLKDADVIKIVNDIGEPEDIFPESSNEETKHQKTPFRKKQLERNTEKWIIFWVCAGIGDFFEIDVLWVRLGFIFFTIAWGAGIIIYLALAFLLPNGTKPTSKEKTEAKRGIIDQLVSLVGTSFRWIFRLFLIIVFGLIGLGLAGCFVWGVIVSGFLLSGGIEFENQYFPAIIPDSLLIAAPLLTVLSLVVVIAIFGSIIGKNLFGKMWWMMVTLLSGIGFILLAAGGFETFQKYMWSENVIQEQMLNFTGNTLEILNNLDNWYNMHHRLDMEERLMIRKEANRKGISIRSTTTIQSQNQRSAQEIIEKINPLVYTLSGNILTIENASWSDFQSRVPYSFPRRNIEIIIPEEMTIVGTYSDWN